MPSPTKAPSRALDRSSSTRTPSRPLESTLAPTRPPSRPLDQLLEPLTAASCRLDHLLAHSITLSRTRKAETSPQVRRLAEASKRKAFPGEAAGFGIGASGTGGHAVAEASKGRRRAGLHARRWTVALKWAAGAGPGAYWHADGESNMMVAAVPSSVFSSTTQRQVRPTAEPSTLSPLSCTSSPPSASLDRSMHSLAPSPPALGDNTVSASLPCSNRTACSRGGVGVHLLARHLGWGA